MNTKELERQERIDAHYRALAKNIWLFGIATVIVSLLIFFGMSSPSYSCPNITVTVKQGDTLDGIIREHCLVLSLTHLTIWSMNTARLFMQGK